MAYDVVRRREVAGSWCCGLGDDVGLDVKLKDKAALFDKVDDLRYDVRKAGAKAGAAVAALAGAVALVGLTGLWNVTRRTTSQRG